MEVGKGTELGKKTEAYMKAGKLVPEPIVLDLFKNYVDRYGAQGHILDGYPRTLAQAKALDALLDLSAVVLFEITEEGVLSRVSGRVIDAEGRSYNMDSNRPPAGVETRRRDDDRPEVVQGRFRGYLLEIEPILNHYRNQGSLVRVNVAGSIGSVLDQLLTSLGRTAEAV
jgi:adenylate kinase